MKYHSLISQRSKFNRFNESFTEFFSLVSYSQVRHPLVSNANPKSAIVVVSSERGFLGDLNSRVIARTLEEIEKNPNAELVVVGKKAVSKLDGMG